MPSNTKSSQRLWLKTTKIAPKRQNYSRYRVATSCENSKVTESAIPNRLFHDDAFENGLLLRQLFDGFDVFALAKHRIHAIKFGNIASE